MLLLACLLSLNVFASPSPERILEIRAVADTLNLDNMLAGVTLKINEALPGPAWAYMTPEKTFAIEYNPQIYMTLNRAGRDFIMFHELGHIKLGHVALPYPGVEGAREYEFEADVFATYAWRKFQRGTDAELQEFFKLLAERTTIPTSDERITLVESILRQISIEDKIADKQ